MMRRALVIDENESALDAFHGALDYGYSVSVARNIDKANELLRRLPGRFCVILIGLLYGDGMAIAELRNNEGLGDTPIIAYAYEDKNQVNADERAAQLGADAFLCLPCAKSAITRCVTRLAPPPKRPRPVRVNVSQVMAVIKHVTTSICLATINEDGVVRYVAGNDYYHAQIGFTRAQLEEEVGDAMSLVHPDDRAHINAALQRLVEEGGEKSYDYRCFRRDGNMIYVHCDASRAVIEGVQDIVLICCTRDDTDKIFAEQSAERSQEQLKIISDNINGGITATVIDGAVKTFVFANDYYFSQLGYTREQFKEEVPDAFLLVHPEDRNRVIREAHRGSSMNTPYTIHYRIIRRDGAIRWMRSNVSIIRMPGIDAPVQLSVANDVTDVVEADLKMVSSSQRLKAIVENIGSGVTAIIPHRDKSVETLFMTERFFALLGYTRAQYMKEHVDTFSNVSPDDREWVKARIDKVYRSGKTDSFDFRAIRRDGREIWLHDVVSVIRLAETDQPVLLSVFTDITEVRERADRLKVLTDNIPGGLAMIESGEKGMRLVYCNDGFYSYTGLSREAFMKKAGNDPLAFMFEEDKNEVLNALELFRAGDHNVSPVYRCHAKDGGFRWFELRGALAEKRGGLLMINLVQFDITGRKMAEEDIRIREEQFRIAAAIGGRTIARYDIKNSTYHHQDSNLIEFGFGEVIENAPQAFIDMGAIGPESHKDIITFYDNIRQGVKSCSVDLLLKVPGDKYVWHRKESTTIYDADGQPSQAILVTTDISQQREKEAVYTKWRQSLADKPIESYSLFRWNLSRDFMVDEREGALIARDVGVGVGSFETHTRLYAQQYVYPEDRESYLAFVNADALLAGYYRGRRHCDLEYREITQGESARWLKLTVELVEYPSSTDVCAYMTYENVDEMKKSELLAKELAENDPLTGVMNRATFARGVDKVIRDSSASQHAFMVFDVDGFKLLNDNFGHAAGDQALIEIATSLRSILRHGDLLGRLGGDEFFIFLKDVPYDGVIEKKAVQICSLVRKTYSMNVHITASIGVAVYPRDGDSFESLYHRADAALYTVKESGKDNFAFYSADMTVGRDRAEKGSSEARVTPEKPGKRRMLIVDDNKINRVMLANVFKDDFIIDTARDGNTALVRMRHYGAALHIVLLDLMMPGLDGYGVLEKMQQSAELRTVPVIVVSGRDEHEENLRAIKLGALDYITKPVDPDLIRLRVESAVSRAENERLRAQNSYLLLQSNEEARYRTVLNSTGTVVVEHDWVSGTFFCDSSISRHIAGEYDGRRLWRIFLSDMVASALDVKAMQDFVRNIANDKTHETGSMTVRLKTPIGDRHWFRMNVFKRVNELQLTDKMILTFNDINAEVTAGEELRFRAERDELTGLYNRRTFLLKAAEMVRAREPNAYIITVGDVDNFKIVNDLYGHAEGDKLLKYLADTILRDVNAVGGLCGRLGNDVFATLIPNSPAAVDRTFGYPEELLANYPLALETTFSIGFYVIHDTHMPIDGMLDRASLAKATVKGKYGVQVARYGEAMRKKLLTEQEITGSMEAALAGGSFDIYLQPQFNHLTGVIDGAEALVRWLHPDKGVMFLPGEFVPLFEKNGFITKLDEYVWNRTAQLLHEWLSTGNNVVPVSVNVSRLDTHDPALCDKLIAIVNKYELPIELFRLEITESLFEEDAERLIAVIHKLHEHGFIIEMDDFGSGYSSLNVLKDVSVDVLKLDMRFFSGQENVERSWVILSAIMRMAHRLGIPVIAEGVETKQQADYLASIGCPLVQGYLYAAPMPVKNFERLLAENTVSPRSKADGRGQPGAARALLSLESVDSELFNNYIGAAVVFEYSEGRLDALRISSRFCDMLRCTTAELSAVGDLTLMHPDDRAHFVETVRRAVLTGEEESVNVRRAFKDSPTVMHMHCALYPLPDEGDGALVLCLLNEIREKSKGANE